ncbi:MAG: class I SAM-dependent methyltransferase, partial [Nitrospirota bacterium]
MSLMPKRAREKADVARHMINLFVKDIADNMPDGAIVLDAGAGNCRYRPYFKRQRYLAADFCLVSGKNYKRMNIITDLSSMALKENSMDAIINIQVLEHVRNPLRLLKELRHCLKPGGSLYLSCPQNWGVHEAPYDFYRFTNYALEDMFKEAGFDIDYIKPMGGYFCFLGEYIKRIPFVVVESPRKNILNRLCFILLKELFFFWVPLVIMQFDFLDKRKDFSIGYTCRVVKP